MTTVIEFDQVAAWNTWCDAFLKAKTIPMSRDQSEIFISLLMMEKAGTPIPEGAMAGFQYQVALKRKTALNLDITPHALMMICVLAGSVGDVVMYVTALTRYYHKHPQTIDTGVLANAFPMGFLPEVELHRLWDEQKGFHLGQRFDNLLDRIFADAFV